MENFCYKRNLCFQKILNDKIIKAVKIGQNNLVDLSAVKDT